MARIEKLPIDELDAYVDIATNAYPSMQVFTAEAKERYKANLKRVIDEDPMMDVYGLWRDDTLVGAMRFYDFTMRLFETTIPVGGVGGVAVHLLHKKEHIAKEMIEFFLRHYQARGAPIVALYAFRHDFYKQMGFGYGTKMSQYRFRPAQLPRRGGKSHVVFAGPGDEDELLACYQRVHAVVHGYFGRIRYFYQRLLEAEEPRVVVYRRDGAIRGYLVFEFKPGKPDNFLINDIFISELVYEDREGLGELVAFLQSQADQINLIVHNTQDEDFHHLLLDPRDDSRNNYHISWQSNTQAVGIMYRIVDTRALFAALAGHNFNDQTCRLRLNIGDSFFPENAGAYTLHVAEGTAALRDDGELDVEVGLDVSELSSLLTGTVSFRSLYDYGLATISEPGKVALVDRLFAVERKPMCITRF